MAAQNSSQRYAGERLSQSSRESDFDKFPMDLISTDNDDDVSASESLQDAKLASSEEMDGVTLQGSHGQTPQKLPPPTPDKITSNSIDSHSTCKDKNSLSESDACEEKGDKDRLKRCLCCRQCCLTCWRPCYTKYNPLPAQPSKMTRFRYALMCPPHGKVATYVTLALTVLFFWAVMWSLTSHHALPGGNFFALIILVVCCMLGGNLVEKMKLPPLLGMLVVGCILRNVPGVDVAKDINPQWSSALRNVALVVILTRAGLGLDPVALRKLSVGVIRLAFIPCLAEALTAAIASHLLLGFPWLWGLMLGFVLAAVSPAVVVPSMLALQEKGMGVDKGIPTLVIAASSVDDVLAISGFGVILGIAFSEGSIAVSIVKGPLEALAGILYGVVFGIISWYIPHAKHESKKLFRFMLLFCGGLFATFGSRAADISGAGALGCLALAFVSALGWRKEVAPDEDAPLSDMFAALWKLFQPLLFGLIGAEIDISTIQPQTIGLGVAVLAIGLVIRMTASFLAVFKLGLTLREKLFIPLAWLPKATVQAAIGSVALDTAREKNASSDTLELGTQLLTIAVLVILITAPIGSIAIALSAPKCLKETTRARDQTEVTSGGKLSRPEEEAAQHMI